jgi:hypothetical protein
VKQFYVKDVMEITGPGGEALNPPVSVWNSPNSTGTYSVVAAGPENSFVWQKDASKEGLGFHDYEIRFGEPSQYYVTGYDNSLSFFPWARDPKGKGTVPFSVYDIGQTPDDPSDDVRLIIKIRDLFKDGDGIHPDLATPDSLWTFLDNGTWEEFYVYDDPEVDPENLPDEANLSLRLTHPFGGFQIVGDRPEDGTIIRLRSTKPLKEGDEFTVTPTPSNFNDVAAAKNKIDEISVFPNPYYGAHSLERNKYVRFMRFTNLPTEATIRIFSLSGVFIRRIDKNDNSQYADWNLQNNDGIPVASGMYIAYIDMPNVGTKVLKLAVIVEQQYIDGI